jgi:hypothetical protein
MVLKLPTNNPRVRGFIELEKYGLAKEYPMCKSGY